MKGGCFGHIMSFVFGIIVGIILLIGTVIGAGYYVVNELTINKVEQISKTKLEFLDESAKIRNKSVMDIIEDFKSGKFKKAYTIDEIEKDFGIDFLEILEKTLDMPLREEGKADVRTIPVMELFKGDNPKKILNCIGLGDILKKAGVDMSNLEDKPLIAEHLDDPMMDGFNGMMDELDLDKLTVGEIQYLMGISFGGGVLDNFRNDKLSEMADAINRVTVENLDPNFSRDTYIIIGDETFRRDGIEAVLMAEAYEPIPEGETVPEDDRYSYNENRGTVSKDKEGGYRLKPGYADLKLSYEDFFAKDKDAERHTLHRHGFYIPTDSSGNFVKAEDRFAPAEEGEGHEKDRAGQFYERFTADTAGTYQRCYVRKFVRAEDGKVSLERRGMVQVSDYDTAATGKFYRIETAYVPAPDPLPDPAPALFVKNADGTYSSAPDPLPDPAPALFVDEHSLEDAANAAGTYCLKEGDSARIMQTFADMTLNTFGDDIKKIKIKDMMDIEPAYVMEESETGDYVTLKQNHTYTGTYLKGHTPDSADELWFVKYKEDLPAEYFGAQRYKMITEAATGFMVRLSEKTVEELEEGLDEDVSNTRLGEVIDIDGDVFVLTDYKNYAEIPASEDILNYYVYTDSERDILRTIADTDTADADVFKKIYDGKGNAVIKKMYGLKIDDIGGERIDAIIDDTRLGEIMTIDDDSPRILKKLENSTVKNMDQDIKNVQLKDIMEIETANVVAKDASGDYVALKKSNLGGVPYTYVGSYTKGHTADDPDTELLLVRWQEGLSADDYHTGDRYTITTEAASGLMATLGEKTVGELEDGMQEDVDNTALGEVIDIDGDVFVLTDYKKFSEIPASEDILDYYVYTDYDKPESPRDMLRTIGSEDTADTEVYKKIHDGKGNAVIKKMFGLKIGDIGGERMNDIVNETRIGEVLADEIREYYEIEENAAGDYIALPALAEGKEYVGTYKTGRIAGGTEDILFVKYRTDLTGFEGCKRYNIAVDSEGNALEQSSGTLIGLKNMKIGDLGKSESGMQNVVDTSLMSDVIDIDGNVYQAIDATSYAAALTALGEGNVYYKDEFGLYLNADGADDSSALSAPFYKLVYEGRSNALLRKFAVLKVADLGNSDAIDRAVRDCRLSDFITAEGDTFLSKLQDSRIANIEEDAGKLLQESTMNELDKWGNLELEGLDKTITVDGETKTIGEMKIQEFIQYAITILTTPVPTP